MCVPEIYALYVSPSEEAKEWCYFRERDSLVAHIIKGKNDQSKNELKFPTVISPSEFIPSSSQGLDIWWIKSRGDLKATEALGCTFFFNCPLLSLHRLPEAQSQKWPLRICPKTFPQTRRKTSKILKQNEKKVDQGHRFNSPAWARDRSRLMTSRWKLGHWSKLAAFCNSRRAWSTVQHVSGRGKLAGERKSLHLPTESWAKKSFVLDSVLSA